MNTSQLTVIIKPVDWYLPLGGGLHTILTTIAELKDAIGAARSGSHDTLHLYTAIPYYDIFDEIASISIQYGPQNIKVKIDLSE